MQRITLSLCLLQCRLKSLHLHLRSTHAGKAEHRGPHGLGARGLDSRSHLPSNIRLSQRGVLHGQRSASQLQFAVASPPGSWRIGLAPGGVRRHRGSGRRCAWPPPFSSPSPASFCGGFVKYVRTSPRHPAGSMGGQNILPNSNIYRAPGKCRRQAIAIAAYIYIYIYIFFIHKDTFPALQSIYHRQYVSILAGLNL